VRKNQMSACIVEEKTDVEVAEKSQPPGANRSFPAWFLFLGAVGAQNKNLCAGYVAACFWSSLCGGVSWDSGNVCGYQKGK